MSPVSSPRIIQRSNPSNVRAGQQVGESQITSPMAARQPAWQIDWYDRGSYRGAHAGGFAHQRAPDLSQLRHAVVQSPSCAFRAYAAPDHRRKRAPRLGQQHNDNTQLAGAGLVRR